MGVRMYFDLGLIRIKGIYVPMVSDKHVSTVVRLNRSITIRPNTTYILCAKVKKTENFSFGKECIISSFSDNLVREEPGLVVTNSVVKLNRSNKVPVEITNYTNRHIKLCKGSAVGRVDLLDKNELMTVCHISGQPSSQVNTSRPTEQDILGQIHTDCQHRRLVNELVLKNLDVFAFNEKDIVPSNLVSMDIVLTDETPFKIKPYKASIGDQKVIDKTVDEWLEAGIISRCRGPYSSSVVVVGKKDGDKRVCVDFRKLNSVTKAYVIRLPCIDEILMKLSKAKFISTFDLKSGFFNVPIDPNSREYTGFSTLKGSYCFNRAPFGLRNSPSYFVELMQRALAGFDDFCSFYVDNIIVWSETLEEHISHINKLFERLRHHQLKLKLKKCQFLKAESEHLGFIVTSSGVKPCQDKVEAIRTLGPPTNVKECRSFVVLCSYYRRFVPNFANISEPIVALTKKHARFKWSEECQKAFEYMKESLTVIPLLSYPDFNKKFILYRDASDSAIGACLVQEQEENSEILEKPLYFLSHKLSPTQCRWSTVEKECYAIHYALEKLHHWIGCSQILVKTDHMPLKYLLNSQFKNRKML